MQEKLNTEPRELSIEELDNASGGLNICGLPAIVTAIAFGIAIRAGIEAIRGLF